VGRVLCAFLIWLGSDIGAAQSQPPQLPPLAMELIEELVAALKPTLPPDSTANADVLRNGILGIAEEYFETLFEGHSVSREITVATNAYIIVRRIGEAAKAKKNGQKTEERKATEEIQRRVSLAYLLVGMGDPPYRPHMIAIRSLSWTVLAVGAGIVCWWPPWPFGDKHFLAGQSVFGAIGIAFIVLALPSNLGRIHIPREMPRLYPKNSMTLTLIRNSVNAKFWKIVAKYLREVAQSDPDVREFLNDWLPGYCYRLWFMTVRGLRGQNTSPAQKFFETLKSKFASPDQSDCSELLDKPATL
jgi:hypothetical protein